MRAHFLILLLAFSGSLLRAQSFQFIYEGPDTLFVDENCEVPLDWGHPDQPSVSSTIGATIDSFYIYSISDDYELNELLSSGIDLEITYKAVDDQGNSEFFSFDLVTYDAISPILLMGPGDESVSCDETGIQTLLQAWYDSNAGIQATDNCGPVIEANMTWEETLIEFNQSTNDLCGNTRSVELIFTVSDESGNSLPEITAVFETYDDEDPQFTQLPIPLDTFCVADIDAILEQYLDEHGGALAIDNCSDNLTWQFLWSDNANNSGFETVGNKPYELQANTNLCNYSVNINFFAKDECGNQEASFTTITIMDDNTPYFTNMPADSLVDCDMIPEAPEVQALDDCKGELIVLFESSSSQADDPLLPSYYNYVIVQSWSSSDGCGHEIEHTRNLMVQDTMAPEFDVPTDLTVSCTEYLDTTSTGTPQNISDGCCELFTIEFMDRIQGSGCSFVVFRDWKVRDIIGNERLKTQTIYIEDESTPNVNVLPVDQDIFCYAEASPESRFIDWINNMGGAEFGDDCNEVFAFAAIPGSYSPDDPETFPGVLPDTDFLLNCTGSEAQLMFSQTVDFVIYDICGNAVVYQRQFRVIDDVLPNIVECPADTVISLPLDACFADYTILAPIANDNCTGSPIEWNYTQSFQINSSVPGDTQVPVDTMTIQLGPLNLETLTLEELLSLQLSFFNLDADDNNEYFVIRGEDGSELGVTPEIDEECGDFVVDLKDLITPEQLEMWVQDKYLELVLEPKIVPGGGVFSINDICGNSFVEFSLVYSTEAISQLNYAFKIDEGIYSEMNPEIPIDTLLMAGQHQLTYRVMDCAGNASECVQEIEIPDQQPPQIFCPDNVHIVLPEDSCSMEIALPDDFSFIDNCMDSWLVNHIQPMDVEDQYIRYTYDEDTDQYIAINKNLSFQLSNTSYSHNPELIIYIQGDIDENGEYFEILDENGQLIGQTPMGSCDSLTERSFMLDPSLFHEWKSDGSIQFVARSVIGDSTVNPCDDQMVTGDGDHDGISQLYMELSFESTVLKYSISGATESEIQEYHSGEVPPIHRFNGGVSTVSYLLYDNAQNVDTCSFTVELEDQQAPVAVCKEAIAIFINPSGVEDYLLLPEEVDNGSYDNCRIDSMAVEPSIFDCTLAGSTVDVTLYVWDGNGNIDSCTTSVKVETLVLEPSYQAGVCAFDTLKLFSNLPDAPEGIYTILWTKENNGFSSNEENPVRPNADASFSGTYSLEVTGLNGCFSTGFVEVFIENLTTPQVISSQDTICTGESVVLETNSYSGNVIYTWYRGIAPNGILVDSTTVPTIELIPAIGQNDYYVIVVSENCISLPSQKQTISVLETPVASVIDPFISICEGDQIVLGTNVSGSNYNYLWWGPDSYMSNDQNPASIEDAGIKNQGTYRLAVFNSICSDTALVQVLVNERPITPVITADSLYCEGETMVLSVGNITNADLYSWYLDGILQTVEGTNTLVLPDAQSIYSGNWQVIAKEGSCYSDISLVKKIAVELKFEISASNTGPVCEGDSIELFAPEIPGAEYSWIGPENETFSVIRPKIIAKPGIYQLEVLTAAGCFLNASTEVKVVQVPEITALSNSAPDCIDGTECIEFKPSVYPNLADYNYSWTGPHDFSSSDSIAVLCQPDTSYNGIYTLIVSNGLCQSEPATTGVQMYMYPQKPVLNATELICENDTLVLSLENPSNDGLVYFWSTPNGNVFQTTTPELVLPQAKISYSGYYSMQSYNGNCYSEQSDAILIEVLKKPNQPVAWTDNAFCEGAPIKLFTNYVEEASYYWEGPNGFTSNVQNPVISPSDTLDEGVYRLTISVDGCFSEISEAVVVNIKRKPLIPQIMGGLEPLCIIDSTTSFELCLTNQEAVVEYSWFHNDSGTLLGQGASSCITISGVEGLIDGLNGFYAVAERDGCSSDPSALMQVQLNLVPDRQANAGNDIEVCNDEELFLAADPDPDGYWVDQGDGLDVIDPFDPESQVNGLLEGENLFIWSLSHGVCYDYNQDTVLVYIIPTPVASDDQYITAYDQDVVIDPIENDLFAEEGEIIIDPMDVTYGTITETGLNQFSFDPSPTFVGNITIPYILVHENCRDKFSDALIHIQVSEADDCFGVNVITPNGDGVNDALLFPCLENPLFPKNKLTVFNQWGDEVFSTSPYNNDWQGTYQGKDLPVGTYYYILDLRNGSTPVRDFFVIER